MRALWVLALLMTAGLAGCTDDAPDPEPEASGPDTITDPTDYSYVENGTGAHVHDYWGGADEQEVLWYTKGHNYNNLAGTSSTWISSFFPPDGSVVPQGTSHLTIVVTWQDEIPEGNSYGAMALWTKPANATEVRLVAEDLENGEAVTMPLTYNESDLPHQLISNWEFQVRIHGSSDPYNAFVGSITLQVTAHRGLDLRPFPAHPDHWGNRTEILLAEEDGSFTQFTYTGTGGFNPRIGPVDGALVPVGASHVEVTLETDNGLPLGDLRMQFHGADSRNWTAAPEPTQDGDAQVYRIPVGPSMHDGPYAKASLWEFLLQTSDEPGQAMYDGTYRLTATVHKAT